MVETDSMVALNREIAEEVMKWQSDGFWWNDSDGQRTGWSVDDGALGYPEPWSPSTDWSAAGEVLEKLKSMGNRPVLGWNGHAWDAAWDIDIANMKPDDWYSAESPQLAICLAALAAVRAQQTATES